MSNAKQTHFLATLTRTYPLLDAVSEQLHAGHGLSAGSRAILLLLDRQGPMTMSEIARDRAVSRQLIQRLASAMLDKGVIAAMPNAAHRKSAKLGLTPQGRSVVEGILLRESGIVVAVMDSIEDIELQQAHSVLIKLNALLAQIRKVEPAKK